MTSNACIISGKQEAATNEAEGLLVERAKRDPVALSELYRQHYPAIYGFIHRRVLDAHEADDIVSDVFLSMVSNLHRYRWRGVPFRVWLYRLATTQLSRWARRRRRWAMQQLRQDPANKQKSAGPQGPDAELIDLALSTLPPRLQAVLSLHYLEGKKVAEIAQVLSCATGTVKWRLSEGRTRMRERLIKRDLL